MDTYFGHFRVHPIHPFPARMAPSIALNCLSQAKSRPLTVLDPMSGSGTTIIAARRRGHIAIGFDTDPLAALLARVSSMPLDGDLVRRRARGVLNRAKQLCWSLKLADSYPANADEETKDFVRYWFDRTNRRQLAALSRAIAEYRGKCADALWCAFSRLIISKENGASLARDLSHSRPHRYYEEGPIRPFDHFLDAAEFLSKNIVFSKADASTPESTVRISDARKLPIVASSVDLVITSPPYLNAIDYVRCSKFTLVWMGYSIEALRKLRAGNIGSEVSLKSDLLNDYLDEICDELDINEVLPGRDRAILARYLQDMDGVISEIGRVLKPMAKAVIVIGNSNIRGHFIENSHALTRLFQRHGMSRRRCLVRDLPPNRRYLPPPNNHKRSGAMHGRMRQEVVLTFRKDD